jgi:hypothetical protein
VAVEDGYLVAVSCLQRPQSLLIGDARIAIDIGLALKIPEHQQHPNLRLQLAVEEVAVAGKNYGYPGTALFCGRIQGAQPDSGGQALLHFTALDIGGDHQS